MRAGIEQNKIAEPVRTWLGAREDEMAVLLAELVAVPTENPPGRQYREFAEMFQRRADQLGLQFEPIKPTSQNHGADDIPLCLCATYGRGERILYFHGHYDVVPAQSEAQFKPLRKDHFLFGRGACDMKGGIVAMLYAILALKECGADLDGKINLILVPDEETGGTRGST